MHSQKRDPGKWGLPWVSFLGLLALPLSVKPLADVVGQNTCRNTQEKVEEDGFHSTHLPLLVSTGGQAVLL